MSRIASVTFFGVVSRGMRGKTFGARPVIPFARLNAGSCKWLCFRAMRFSRFFRFNLLLFLFIYALALDLGCGFGE